MKKDFSEKVHEKNWYIGLHQNLKVCSSKLRMKKINKHETYQEKIFVIHRSDNRLYLEYINSSYKSIIKSKITQLKDREKTWTDGQKGRYMNGQGSNKCVQHH